MLVGITCIDSNGREVYSFELHGPVVYARRGDKISIKVESDPIPSQITLNEDRVYSLPPDLSGLKTAAAGVYKLSSTGEEIADPDLLASWSLIAPES